MLFDAGLSYSQGRLDKSVMHQGPGHRYLGRKEKRGRGVGTEGSALSLMLRILFTASPKPIETAAFLITEVGLEPLPFI